MRENVTHIHIPTNFYDRVSSRNINNDGIKYIVNHYTIDDNYPISYMIKTVNDNYNYTNGIQYAYNVYQNL